MYKLTKFFRFVCMSFVDVLSDHLLVCELPTSSFRVTQTSVLSIDVSVTPLIDLGLPGSLSKLVTHFGRFIINLVCVVRKV